MEDLSAEGPDHLTDTARFIARCRHLLRAVFSEVMDRSDYWEFERQVLVAIEREHRDTFKREDGLSPV